MTDTIGKLVFAALTLALFGSIAGYCLYKGPSEAVQQQLITASVAWVGVVVGYYFGSSAGSSSKDKTIADISSNKAP